MAHRFPYLFIILLRLRFTSLQEHVGNVGGRASCGRNGVRSGQVRRRRMEEEEEEVRMTIVNENENPPAMSGGKKLFADG